MVNLTLPFTTNKMILISTSQTFRSCEVIFNLRWPIAFLFQNLYDTSGIAPRMNVVFLGPGDFPVSYSNKDTFLERLKSSFGKFNGRYGDVIQQYEVSLSRTVIDILTLHQQWLPIRSAFPSISGPWYQAWPSPKYWWFPWSICKGLGMLAGNAYSSWHIVPTPFLGFPCAPIVETIF